MGDTAGSLRGVKLNGIPFDVMADANAKQNPKKEKEGIATSGRTLIKVTKKVPTKEAIDLACNPSEFEVLEDLNESNRFSMSAIYADGSVYRATGTINLEGGHESETNKATIVMIPVGKWELFASA